MFFIYSLRRLAIRATPFSTVSTFNAAAIWVLLAQPAFAQDQSLMGVAFAEAPEMATGLCFADNADAGLACAKDKCIERGVERGMDWASMSRGCLRVAWCYPARWSADIAIMHKMGMHFHRFLCGWSTREDIEAASGIVCADPNVLMCNIILIDPQGNELPGQLLKNEAGFD